MDRIILDIRCGTLRAFLDRIETTPNVSEKLRIGVEASKIAEKIIAITNRRAFRPREWDDIEKSLEHYSLAVFCDHTEWARASLDCVLEVIHPMF